VRPAFKNQVDNVKRVWNNEHNSDFGIERLLRLFLVCVQFVFPGLYIRHLGGKWGFVSRKIFVEMWVIAKLALPIAFLATGIASNIVVFFLVWYLFLETVLYLMNLMFLTDVYARPASAKRSILTLIMNYLEITLDFACIYFFLSSNDQGFFNVHVGRVDIVYFSFVTSATVGYGDILVMTVLGKTLVVSQIVLSFMFVVMFFNFFSTNSSENSYLTDHNKRDENGGTEKKQNRP
jgi:hypothetical protein